MWLLSCLPWLAGTAQAQEVAVDLAAEADLHFSIALERYRRGDFTGALEHLLRSNRLAPNRNVLFNIARTWERLGDARQAYRAYAQFAAEEPDPARRQPALDAMDALSAQLALVTVESDPPGATVYVDRVNLGARGVTPLTLALEPGAHTVLLQADGHEDAAAPVELVVGETVPARLALAPLRGTLRVAGRPEGAEVRLADGTLLGVVPLEATVPAGARVLTVTAPGHAPATLSTTVPARGEVALAAELQRLTGRLVVEAPERGARVTVDGEAVGFTPAVVDVPVGVHDVVVTLEGARPFEARIDVVADGEVQLDARLPSLTEASAASRVLQAVEDAPASVSVLTGRDLRAFGWQTVAQAVEGLRGVYVTDDLSYTSLGIRGFSRQGDYGNRLLVTMDGHTLNDDQNGASYVSEDLMVDLHDVTRIELVRGPGSALYGTNALLGVLNVVTRDAASNHGLHGAASVDERRTVRARAGYGGGDATLGGWVSASGLISDGLDPTFEGLSEDGPLTVTDAERGRAYSLRGKLWWKDLTVQAHVNGRTRRFPTGAFETLPGDERARNNDLRGFVELRWEPRLSERVRFLGRVYGDVYRYAGDFPYEDTLASDRWIGGWIGLEPRVIVTPVDWVDLTVGAEVRTSVRAHIRGGDEQDTWLDQDVSQQVFSGYVVAELAPVRWFRATVGGRYDHFTLEGVGGAFNPRGALLFKPTEEDVLKAMVGTAFRAPSAYERIYNDGGITQVAPDDLDPERILTAELEYSRRFGEAVTLSVGGFYNRLGSLIDIEAAPGDEALFRYANTADVVQTVGAEAEVLRAWRQGWTAALQASWQRSRVGDLVGDAELSNSPWLLIGGRAAAPLIPRVATLATRVVVDSPRLTRDGDPTRWGVLWDVNLAADLPGLPLGMSLGVRNLLDWKRVSPTGFEVAMPTVPGAPRSFFFELRANL